MILHIVETKELDRHWLAMEKKNERIKHEARKAERDRKRLEKGSDYETEDDVKQEILEETSYYSSEESDEYEMEENSYHEDGGPPADKPFSNPDITDIDYANFPVESPGRRSCDSPLSIRKSRLYHSRKSMLSMNGPQFNALRFIGLHLRNLHL